MINKSTVRRKNKASFLKCIELRKQGLSYGEIRKIVPVAKSTLQNWLTLAGLTLTHEHLEIQLKKRLEKRAVAREASRITRRNRASQIIESFIQEYKKFYKDPFFVSGLMMYEAEGSKEQPRFSNSDYRLMQLFINFLERYFGLDRLKNMSFSLYLHTTREKDLEKIKGFWSTKLGIPKNSIKVCWKRNLVRHRRDNPDYVGQFSVYALGVPYLSRKLLALSGIILSNYCRPSVDRI